MTACIASFASYWIFLGIVRGFLFLLHLLLTPNPGAASFLLCSMGIVSFLGDVIFHFTVCHWPLSHMWSFTQKLIWAINECFLLSGIILMVLFGIQNQNCCTMECTVLFFADAAFLILFSLTLVMFAIPFLRHPVMMQVATVDQRTYNEL